MPVSPALRAALAFAALIALFVTALLLGGPESPLDRTLLFRAQVGALVPAARWLTRLGDASVVFLAGAGAAAWLLWRGAARRALLLVVLLLSCRLLVEGLKLLFDRARPDPAGHEVAVHSMAFPSGHAANAMAAWLGIALLAAPPRLRLAAIAAALAVASVVGLSRLVLGVHWPSDVAGGWALGAAWTLALARLAGGTSPSERH
jgi:undecaprenyl-diphosphatase